MTATYCNDGPYRELNCIGVEITDELRESPKTPVFAWETIGGNGAMAAGARTPFHGPSAEKFGGALGPARVVNRSHERPSQPS